METIVPPNNENKSVIETLPVSVREKNRWLPFLLIVFLVSAGILFWTLEKKLGPQKEDFPEEPGGTTSSQKTELIPTNAKSPSEFMEIIKTRPEEIQKEYDSNLTDFSRRKWRNITKEINGLDESFFGENFVIVNQETVKDSDQNVLFKIKYRAKINDKEVENEDFFYLIVSEAKINELDLVEIKANTFLEENDIKKQLGKEGFIRINKIEK